MTKCSLRSIVVPRYAVIINEGEQGVLVPLKSLPIARSRFAHESLSRDHFSIEAINPIPVFAEVPRLEAEPLSVFEKRNQQSTNSRDKALEFVVKWILPKIIVQVPDQMDEAFLLRARKRIISSIKIGYDGALEFGKQWFQEFRFTVRPQPENYPSIVGKDPNILVRPRDIYLCFIVDALPLHPRVRAAAHPRFADSVQRTSQQNRLPSAEIVVQKKDQMRL